MAQLLFNRLAGAFHHSAMVEIQVGDGADKMAQHLATALEALGAHGESAEGSRVLLGRLQSYVEDKRVLFVLDNVWTASQLDNLLPTKWGEGSVVVITSRFDSFTESDIWPQVRLANKVLQARQHHQYMLLA